MSIIFVCIYQVITKTKFIPVASIKNNFLVVEDQVLRPQFITMEALWDKIAVNESLITKNDGNCMIY